MYLPRFQFAAAITATVLFLATSALGIRSYFINDSVLRTSYRGIGWYNGDRVSLTSGYLKWRRIIWPAAFFLQNGVPRPTPESAIISYSHMPTWREGFWGPEALTVKGVSAFGLGYASGSAGASPAYACVVSIWYVVVAELSLVLFLVRPVIRLRRLSRLQGFPLDPSITAGDGLALAAGAVEPTQAAVIVGLFGLLAGAGFSVILLLVGIFYVLNSPRIDGNLSDMLVLSGGGLLIEGGCLLVWIKSWNSLRRHRSRWLLAGLGCVPSLLNVVVVATNIR